MEERRCKGLCFLCQEKYTFGHKYANKRVYVMVLKPEEEEEVTKVEKENQLPEQQEDPLVSLHALHGVKMHSINQTMKLIGFYKRKRLSILVDS